MIYNYFQFDIFLIQRLYLLWYSCSNNLLLSYALSKYSFLRSFLLFTPRSISVRCVPSPKSHIQPYKGFCLNFKVYDSTLKRSFWKINFQPRSQILIQFSNSVFEMQATKLWDIKIGCFVFYVKWTILFKFLKSSYTSWGHLKVHGVLHIMSFQLMVLKQGWASWSTGWLNRRLVSA